MRQVFGGMRASAQDAEGGKGRERGHQQRREFRASQLDFGQRNCDGASTQKGNVQDNGEKAKATPVLAQSSHGKDDCYTRSETELLVEKFRSIFLTFRADFVLSFLLYENHERFSGDII